MLYVCVSARVCTYHGYASTIQTAASSHSKAATYKHLFTGGWEYLFRGFSSCNLKEELIIPVLITLRGYDAQHGYKLIAYSVSG